MATASAAAAANPGSGASAQPQAWTQEDEGKVISIVADAMFRKNGDVALAFEYLRDLRQKKENYFDMNLAIAADYLRARWETLKWGPTGAGAKVEGYMELKQRNLIIGLYA
jgi:hypothetical protein